MSRLIGNIRYTILEQAVLSTHVFVTLALIRHLGPEQYGVYNYYLSVCGIASILTFGGFGNLYVREVARTPAKGALTSSFLLLNGLGSVLACAALWIYYLIYRDSDRLSSLLMAFAMLSTFGSLKGTLRDFFIACQNVRRATLLTIGVYLFNTALKLAAILTGQPLPVFIFLIAVDTVVSVVVFGTAYGWRHLARFEGVVETVKFFFRNGWPLLITGLSILVFMKLDQVMVFHMRTEREAGSYASMIWLVEKTFIFIGVVMTAFFPYLSAQHAADRSQYLKAVRVGHKLFALVCIPMVVFLIPNRTAVLDLLFGHRFSGNSDALIFLACGIPFIYWGAINQKVLVVTNALKLDLFYAATSAILNVVLNLLLIPRYGTLGAGAAMLVAHSFYFWAQFLVPDYRNYNFYMLLSLPLPLLASLLGLLLSRLLPGGIIVQGLVYVAVYAALIASALRAGISDEYATLSRLMFTKAIRAPT
jgi:O-antigen/teichoic acid export membrane protein